MTRAAATILLALAASGCLSPAPKEPRNWLIGPASGTSAAASGAPRWKSARITKINVSAPYDERRLAVLRPDGSVAFDSANVFAAAPSALARDAAFETLAASGLAGTAVGSRSAASAERSIEITVTRLALDCREEGRRDASVALSVAVLAGSSVESFARGEAAVPAGADFTAAYSKAFCRALAEALGRL